MRIACIAAVAVTMVACGSPKPAAQSGATLADSTQRVQAPPPDKIGAAPEPAAKAGPVDTAKKTKADTTKPTVPKRDDRLRDSAVGPKYMVDSTGKVTPIKPPVKRP